MQDLIAVDYTTPDVVESMCEVRLLLYLIDDRQGIHVMNTYLFLTPSVLHKSAASFRDGHHWR